MPKSFANLAHSFELVAELKLPGICGVNLLENELGADEMRTGFGIGATTLLVVDIKILLSIFTG